MEVLGYGALSIGGLIAFIGWVWLMILGFKQGGILWGLLILLFSAIGGLIFCIVYKTGWLPFSLLVIGGIITGFGIVPMLIRQL